MISCMTPDKFDNIFKPQFLQWCYDVIEETKVDCALIMMSVQGKGQVNVSSDC